MAFAVVAALLADPLTHSFALEDKELTMGADTVYAFFGVRYLVESAGEMEAVEERTDERVKKARAAGIAVVFDRPTDGEPHFLMLGHSFGAFGVEGEVGARFTEQELMKIIQETKGKLTAAGFADEPGFLVQLSAQY